MSSYITLFVLLGVSFVFGDETLVPTPTQQKAGTLVDTQGFSISNGYDVKAIVDHKGAPGGSVNVYGGGRVGSGIPYFRENPVFASTGTAFFAENGNYLIATAFVGGAVVALLIWYACLWVVGAKRLLDFEDLKETKDDNVKSRKRRAIQDDQLNTLANIVLTAVENGQCMEKSICLLGTQLGAGSGKSILAASLLDKMIPKKVQNSIYFLTLQNALRGKAHCDKIYCAPLK